VIDHGKGFGKRHCFRPSETLEISSAYSDPRFTLGSRSDAESVALTTVAPVSCLELRPPRCMLSDTAPGRSETDDIADGEVSSKSGLFTLMYGYCECIEQTRDIQYREIRYE
jgi:hypothetical protein